MIDINGWTFEFMGFEDGGHHWWCPDCNDWVPPNQVSCFQETHEIELCGSTVRPFKEFDGDWDPATNDSQALWVQRRVISKGHGSQYLHNLMREVLKKDFSSNDLMEIEICMLLDASPEKRCLAAKQAVESVDEHR